MTKMRIQPPYPYDAGTKRKETYISSTPQTDSRTKNTYKAQHSQNSPSSHPHSLGTSSFLRVSHPPYAFPQAKLPDHLPVCRGKMKGGPSSSTSHHPELQRWAKTLLLLDYSA